MAADGPIIGIDVTAAVTQGGGIGRYTRELMRALVADNGDSHSYRYRLFSARRPPQLPVPEPLPQSERVTFHEAPLSARWLYRLWYRLRLPLPVQLITGHLDLFHSPDFVLPPLRGNPPTLLTVHDLSFLHYPQTFTPALVNYLNRVVPRSVARATHVLADSQATRADLLQMWQVPPEKVTVLYSGVDARFRPIADQQRLQAMRRKYGLGDFPYLFSISTIQPRKNYQMLIQAFKPLAAHLPHHLAIAGGKGWLYEEVLAEVERQGLQERVHFLGFAADGDLPALYSAADLFLFPSLYEGFGLPLLEAMACGLPVLTSNSSSLPEVAGAAALQLSPHEPAAWTAAIERLLQDEQQRAQMRAAGFQQARRFTWQKAAGELRQLYHQLLSG